MNRQQIRKDCSGNSCRIPCLVSSSTPGYKQGVRGFIGYLISCCPYTILSKKILRFLLGETGKSHEPLTNREHYLKSQIKIGYGIMLIGVFCPIFWISFLSGARGNELWLNTVHSLIVILFGFLYFAVYQIQLRNELVQGRRKERTSQETP
ncbi:MAG TPA: hypothetical protein VN227_07895 [Methanoregula sp.]|nr:hypothetical protein [Methanoregula sp.]